MPPEFSRRVVVERIGQAGHDVTVEADAAERAALSARLQLPAVNALVCRFRLRPAPGGTITAEGWLDAVVTQTCVVSLEDFTSPVSEHFYVQFVPIGTESDDIDPESVDDVPYDHGVIDLGEAATEQLALVLDPWPRKPGATPPEAEADAPSSPFSALIAKRMPI